MDRQHVNRVGYFIAPDAFNDEWLWRERGAYPVPVIAKRDLRDDLAVWEVLVAWADPAPDGVA